MICVIVSVSENRHCLRLYLYISDHENVLLFLELFTLFDLPLYSFPSVGVNRSVSGGCVWGEGGSGDCVSDGQ